MLSSRLTVFAVAGLLVAAGCNDTTAPNLPPNSRPSIPLKPEIIVISGSVHLTGIKLHDVVLNTSDGMEIPLAGASTALLARVDDAGVEVRGSWNLDGTFEVADFVVQMVGGTPVLDGVLVAMYDTPLKTDDRIVLGYALQLTRGDIVELKDPSTDLLAHIGERVWVAGPTDGPPTAFGVISE